VKIAGEYSGSGAIENWHKRTLNEY